MNKKFNSKALLTIFVLCCFLTTGLWAAREVELSSTNANGFLAELNQKALDGGSLASVFGLGQDDDLTVLRARTDFNRAVHTRYNQTYKGIPVWGHQTVISRDSSGKAIRLHGSLVLDISTDVGSVPSIAGLNPRGALENMKNTHMNSDANARWNFENEEYGTFIYIKKNGRAKLCYVVSFYADNENGNPSRMVYIINVKNGNVIHSYDNLQWADGTGPGGNLKIGEYYYGPTGDYPAFGVTVAGSTCTMNTTDVKTVDLNHGTSGTTAYSYTCYENTHEEINGAYCPLNDAQYFGQVVYDMYQDWYGTAVLPFQLTMKVHYSSNYENAFWNGSSMTFGDGYSTFHPLVCLDVSAHEVSHGFTEFNSDLNYSGESGGINEAFSDMAGEAAEYYSRGTNDFMCGYDIFKAAGQALRYLYDPPLDGISIDHVDDYYSGMDVHYSSGVYNKVFYLLAVTSGWDTQKSFDVFTKANMDYWVASTSFQSGAQGVLDAAADYGYNCGDVVAAFAAVGIPLTCPEPPVADFSATPTSGGYPLTVNFTDLSTNSPTSWLWNFGDTGTSTVKNPTHVYASSGTYTVTLTATNGNGTDSETKTNYITVSFPDPPVADFVASNTNPYIGQTVNFTDTTTNSPTSWSWSFEGGTPAASTDQNPAVQYNNVGTYSVTLTATNVAGTDDITKTGYITVTDVPLVYCDSQGNNYSYEYIGNVTVDAFSNSSAGSNYTDYTGMTAYLTAGDTVNVSLLPVFPSTTYTEYWKIWIDYNLDGDFEDSGEEVFSGVGTSTVTGSFTVASVDVTTRMRVSMKWNAAQTPCEAFSYGEVEDYTVNITGVTPPDPPVADFSASATTIDVGDSVTFTDLSTNSPTSWSWSFAGGTPSSSTVQNPTVQYNTAGTYDVTLTATNAGGSDGETKTDYITVNVVVPDPPVANFSATPTTVTEGGSVAFTDLSTNTPTSWSWSFPGGTPSTSTAQNPTVVYNTDGDYDVTLTVTNAGGSDGETKTDYITVNDPVAGLLFESGTVSGVGSSWQSVSLANTYASPVVVCSTGIADSSALPAVVRVRNAAGNSFDVMVQNPSGSALSGHTVHYVVVEEGVYTSAVDGVTMEAVKANSTATAYKGSWTTEARSYQNTYTNPVVVGQVMTANDAGWSVFWACGAARNAPPSASTLNAGKEVAEDTDTTRADETIGYIVIEQGSGTINSIPYTAALGADTVRGPSNTSTGYTYNFTSVGTASAAIVSTAAMDGGNGGWPVLYGSNPFTASSIVTVFDEDQIGDSERAHTPEQVAYIVFGQ